MTEKQAQEAAATAAKAAGAVRAAMREEGFNDQWTREAVGQTVAEVMARAATRITPKAA